MASVVNQTRYRGGRPKKPVRRESATGVRFTKAEYFIVKQKAARAGAKITAYIREIAITGTIVTRMSEEEKQLTIQLAGMANNLNQLTRKAHTEGMLSLALQLQEQRLALDQLLDRINRTN